MSAEQGKWARRMRPDFGAWADQVGRAGFCLRPVRLSGRADAVNTSTGEVVASYSTAGAPDGVLLKACGDRRTAVCPPCAERYRADTFHVVAAGLGGQREGVGSAAAAHVPDSVADHPAVFVTLTAPSFGHVHAIRKDGTCRPRNTRPVCEHGYPKWCNTKHAEDDVTVGAALCVECYDYGGHILWHSAVPELWRRFTMELPRAVARLSVEHTGEHRTVSAVREQVRASYIKVSEWQRRAAVHMHAVVRLDGVDSFDRSAVIAPPAWADRALLAAAVRDAAARVRVGLPWPDDVARVARWGGQMDVKPIGDARRTAAYLAKYATKTASDAVAGLPVRAFGGSTIDRLRKRGVHWHVLMLAGTCLRLAATEECSGLRLAEHVHTLGFAGHFATKSRRYSTTLKALRAVRRDWRAGQREGDVWAAAGAEVVGSWSYVGIGYDTPGDALMAEQLAREEQQFREAAERHDVRKLVTDAEVTGC